MESEDFVSWSTPVEVLRGSQEAQTYSMPVFRYADVYLGLPAIFYTSGELHGHVTTELAWSPDTEIWNRIDEGSQLIPLSETEGDIGWGCIFAAASPVVLKDEIRIYYSGQKRTHDWNSGWLCMATMRPDGWAGYVTNDDTKPGSLVTKPLLCDGNTLRLTADIETGGMVTVEVLDAAGRVITKSHPLTSDMTDAVVADVSSLRNKRVQVRLAFKDAKVYALRFAPIPLPPSFILVI